MMRKFLRKNKDEVLFGAFFFMQFITLRPEIHNIPSYMVFQHLLGYQYGFISRGFIGTLIYPLGYLSYAKTYIIFTVATFIMTVSCLLFYHYMLSGFDKGGGGQQNKDIIRAILWTTAFIPTSICMYYLPCDFGRLDIYLLTLSFLIAWIVCKKKFLWLVIPLSWIEVLIYPAAVFMHFLIPEALLLYLAANDVKGSKIIFWVNSISTSLLFLYFLFAKANLNLTLEQLKLDIMSRTAIDLRFWIGLVDGWYGIELSKTKLYYLWGNVNAFLIYTIMMIPLLFLILKFLLLYFKGKNKLYVSLLALLPLGHMPYLLLMTDYGRLYSSFFWMAFILILVILKTDNEAFKIAYDMNHQYSLSNRKWILWVYMLLLGVSAEGSIVALSRRLSYAPKKISQLIMRLF